jgi:nickel-dependent lactate racemase
MAIGLKYGLTEVSLNLPAKAVALSHMEPQLSIDPDTFKRNLHSNLNNVKKSIRDVGIVVSDKTRLCEYPIYLPLLTEVLSEQGINTDDITFHIAYGTHQIQSEEESLAGYGEIYKRYRFVHHDSRDESRLTLLGTTSRGTEVKISKKVLEHDLLITFGAILHHYFAGFGGGRKLLFPGVAGFHSILQNHQLFLDFEQMKIKEGCQSGNLDTGKRVLVLP